MRLNVTSEIGKLRRVLVHLPGREIDDMVPPMMGQLLFDDILYGQVAREEHRRFQQLIRFVAEDVYEMQDLLEETLEEQVTLLPQVRQATVGHPHPRTLAALAVRPHRHFDSAPVQGHRRTRRLGRHPEH